MEERWKRWGVKVPLFPECISPHGRHECARVLLLRVLRQNPPFLPIGSNLKKTLFCLELEGFLGSEQEGLGGPFYP